MGSFGGGVLWQLSWTVCLKKVRRSPRISHVCVHVCMAQVPSTLSCSGMCVLGARATRKLPPGRNSPDKKGFDLPHPPTHTLCHQDTSPTHSLHNDHPLSSSGFNLSTLSSCLPITLWSNSEPFLVVARGGWQYFIPTSPSPLSAPSYEQFSPVESLRRPAWRLAFNTVGHAPHTRARALTHTHKHT